MTSKPTVEEKELTARPSRGKQAVTTDAVEYRRSEQFDDIVAVAKELFLEKNKQYADSITRTGLLGAVVSVAGISARLEHMVLGSSDAGKSQEEAIKDIIKDLLNYAAIAGIKIMEDNWRPGQ